MPPNFIFFWILPLILKLLVHGTFHFLKTNHVKCSHCLVLHMSCTLQVANAKPDFASKQNRHMRQRID